MIRFVKIFLATKRKPMEVFFRLHITRMMMEEWMAKSLPCLHEACLFDTKCALHALTHTICSFTKLLSLSCVHFQFEWIYFAVIKSNEFPVSLSLSVNWYYYVNVDCITSTLTFIIIIITVISTIKRMHARNVLDVSLHALIHTVAWMHFTFVFMQI